MSGEAQRIKRRFRFSVLYQVYTHFLTFTVFFASQALSRWLRKKKCWSEFQNPTPRKRKDHEKYHFFRHCFSCKRVKQPYFIFYMTEDVLPIYRVINNGIGVS
jgi:hypothetical protein